MSEDLSRRGYNISQDELLKKYECFAEKITLSIIAGKNDTENEHEFEVYLVAAFYVFEILFNITCVSSKDENINQKGMEEICTEYGETHLLLMMAFNDYSKTICDRI